VQTSGVTCLPSPVSTPAPTTCTSVADSPTLKSVNTWAAGRHAGSAETWPLLAGDAVRERRAKYNSRYRDLPSCDPLYAFGYGLSYTTFSIANLHLSAQSIGENGKVTASVDVTNTGSRTGDDVVQLYIHDPVASISQPVRRLRGFQRVTLAPGATQTVTFTLDKSDFGFYDNRARFVVEPGTIDVYAGDSSAADLTQSFTVTG
jgi:fibronectin type III domain protein